MKNIIGITMGDPRGIGPEIVAKAWKTLSEEERDQVLIYGDHSVLDQAAMLASTEFDPKHLVTTSSASGSATNLSDAEAARTALSAIDAAVEDIKSGKISAIVTAPVNKHRIQSILPHFLGHTEYLAKATGLREPTMMFCSEGKMHVDAFFQLAKRLCVSLVTMHLPIKNVAKSITKERVLSTIRRTHKALDEYFACPDARIAVMALNPHAGEGGSIGHEDDKFIAPAVIAAEDEGINCVGPIPADSLFNKMVDFDYDAVVAMYHDQGLLPVKLLCQGRCVNITLGLPYIRTSPSHGTAEDMAWLGQADHENMVATIHLTRALVGWKVNDNQQGQQSK
ncbi:MAG: 4-hydroxythreonine-4-phosphate dehydrogenase PdxA [Pseudomonadota bacterium]